MILKLQHKVDLSAAILDSLSKEWGMVRGWQGYKPWGVGSVRGQSGNEVRVQGKPSPPDRIYHSICWSELEFHYDLLEGALSLWGLSKSCFSLSKLRDWRFGSIGQISVLTESFSSLILTLPLGFSFIFFIKEINIKKAKFSGSK